MFGGRKAATTFSLLHDGFVYEDNSQVIGLCKRKVLNVWSFDFERTVYVFLITLFHSFKITLMALVSWKKCVVNVLMCSTKSVQLVHILLHLINCRQITIFHVQRGAYWVVKVAVAVWRLFV